MYAKYSEIRDKLGLKDSAVALMRDPVFMRFSDRFVYHSYITQKAPGFPPRLFYLHRISYCAQTNFVQPNFFRYCWTAVSATAVF